MSGAIATLSLLLAGWLSPTYTCEGGALVAFTALDGPRLTIEERAEVCDAE